MCRMGFVILCKVCGEVLFRSDEIVQPVNVLHKLGFVCPHCHSQLVTSTNPLDITRLIIEPAKKSS